MHCQCVARGRFEISLLLRGLRPAIVPHCRFPRDVTFGHIAADGDRIALGIEGTVAMTTIGVLASLCRALADARVPVFAISTYDTDWLLVAAERFDAARAALERAGHRVEGRCPA